jgi:hypothetical protein
MLARLKRAWVRHGSREFIRLAYVNICYAVRRTFEREDPTFDVIHGTETRKLREIGSLDIDSPNTIHAVRYQPSSALLVNEILAGLQLHHSDYVFIDYGSGKGRVLLTASHFPFLRIIGIEFSAELHKVAVRNVEIQLPGDRRIEPICQDVVDFEPPREPLVCYFYNPFDEVVLLQVVKKLLDSFRAKPRSLFAIYVDPKHSHIFDAHGWVLHKEHGPARVYALLEES